jgi:hypothetical protein
MAKSHTSAPTMPSKATTSTQIKLFGAHGSILRVGSFHNLYQGHNPADEAGDGEAEDHVECYRNVYDAPQYRGGGCPRDMVRGRV